MTLKEYKIKLDEITSRHKKELNSFYKEVAMENARFKEGDVVEDHIGKAVVKRIYSISHVSYNTMPSVSYLCDNLTKSGSISKREPKRVVYDKNIE